jgi:hypothetical protein
MNRQYKVTEVELKEMIAKFQLSLKENIIKTTKDLFFELRYLIILISEYTIKKTSYINAKSHKVFPF